MQIFAAVRGNEALGGCFWSKTSVAAEVRARHYQGAALRCCCSDGAAYLPTYLPTRSWALYRCSCTATLFPIEAGSSTATLYSASAPANTPYYREYPKKPISKEVTAYNQVFYPERRRLLRHYA